MEKGKAFTKYVRISPRKARLAADLIRGMNAEEALDQLVYCGTKGGKLLKKTLYSAMANAETTNDDVRREELKVVEVRVDEGPTLKRAKARCRGGRSPILKRTSHFTIKVGL